MPDRTHYQQIGRKGGLISAAVRTPAQEANRKQRSADGRMRRFLEQIPAEITDEGERLKRARLLQRAHMQEMARKSAVSRSKRVA